MASGQGNCSSDPTDINYVLENLGSLIGELDACVAEVDEKVSACFLQSWAKVLGNLAKTVQNHMFFKTM